MSFSGLPKMNLAFRVILSLVLLCGGSHALHSPFSYLQGDSDSNDVGSTASDLRDKDGSHPYPFVQEQTTHNRVGLVDWAYLLGKSFAHKILAVVLHRPPVGVVALVLGTRLIFSGRLLHLLEDGESKEETGTIKKYQEASTGLQVQLDPEDTEFLQFGGGSGRRRRMLCLAALEEVLGKHNQPDPLLQATVDALRISLRQQTNSRIDMTQQLIQSLATIESLTGKGGLRAAVNKYAAAQQGFEGVQVDNILMIAILSIEALALDMLMRAARDRLLKATYRLYRTKNKWDRRVKAIQKNRWTDWWFQKTNKGGIESAIQQLTFTNASFRIEADRLGKLTTAIVERQLIDVDEEIIVKVLKASEKKSDITTYSFDARRGEKIDDKIGTLARKSIGAIQSAFRRPPAPVHKSQGGIETDSDIDGLSAAAALQEVYADGIWLREAERWVETSRGTLFDSVVGVLQTSSSKSETTDVSRETVLTEQAFVSIAESWRRQELKGDISRLKVEWETVCEYVDSLASFRRIGALSSYRIKDMLKDWWWYSKKSLDFLGIPSYLLSLVLANNVHVRLKPYWPEFRRQTLQLAHTVYGIIIIRVWIPLKGIIDDVMNRSEGMMAAFSLKDEEITLDHMLQDIGCGDGTPAARTSALHAATETYERSFEDGSMLWNFASGKMVRLLLVQVQQLKVGMLSALDTIDVLIQGNRIHFQILAAIPAVWAFTYGTRLFVRGLYNVRAKDLRPVTAVHADMALIIDKMEMLLLRAASDVDSTSLTDAEIGEFTLHMYRYLILLDYGRPTFSPLVCDQIHHMLQQLLVWLIQKRSMITDQVKKPSVGWEFKALQFIQTKHQTLSKKL
ncbi:hypothetical protein FisN_23Hh150 [Fistulifera solaris]|uniref:Nuclear control of ATPase protein 2 n=1 Tax=Fistulifera solaris TaxID=1519565 RepID=A0A1Z5KN10_FISSO|nr:hypothetical protein FisN_23Hh150 [Fistulifera solaris]|eukprot:GAX27391.1 hypothetical protein FisN_23Hh150 [Fistulifera solaris]